MRQVVREETLGCVIESWYTYAGRAKPCIMKPAVKTRNADLH
jgi:hypothetical protein